MMMRNKKGAEIQVVLLVLLTLVLVGFTLYTFITKTNSLSSEIVQPRFLEQVRIEEGKVKLFLEERANAALEETKTLLEKDKSKDGFKNQFKTSLKNRFNLAEPSDASIINLKNLIVNDQFSLDFDGEILKLETKELEIVVKNKEETMLLLSKLSVKLAIEI